MQKLTVNDSTKGSSSTALAFTLAIAAKFTYSVTVTRTHCECAACLLLVPPGPQAIGPNHSPYSALDNGRIFYEIVAFESYGETQAKKPIC